jgi:serine phosphatase RsbU (regulator of sigma subunit)
MGICTLNTKTHELNFSGAFHSLFICNNDELIEIKGNRDSIGFSINEKKKEFINHHQIIEKGSTIYLSSDGLPDQFGGVKGKKLKWKGLKSKLVEWHQHPIKSNKKQIKNFFYDWRNDQEQLDDVCIMGVRI